MKITTILSDEIISEVKRFAKGKNLTDSLTIALTEWVAVKKIRSLNHLIKNSPLLFKDDFFSETIRDDSKRI